VLTAPTVSELATFSGRSVSMFGDFAPQALAQASLMFSIVTKLSAYPDDPDMAQLARNAILEMADRLLLEQPFAEAVVRPFQSETIGNYSYSRTTTTSGKVQNGLKTGLFWWDIAVDELTVAGVAVTASGSIRVDLDGVERGPDGAWMIVNPAADEADRPPYIRIS
jgi:hypothetical protein